MSKDSNLKISVILPVYNANIEQLRLAIDSIINQTYKQFEFIILDDGSTNKCFNILNEYNDNRIVKYVNKKNLGLIKTLNIGLQIAKGEYIIRMDSDDISAKDRIEKQLKFINNNPKYDIIGTRAYFFDENGVFGESKLKGEINKNEFSKGTPFIHPSLLIKRKKILEIGGYKECLRCEDYVMEMEMYINGSIGYIIDEKLLYYRLDNNCYKKKKNKDRLIELKVKIKYFYKLKLAWIYYIYSFKPILSMIVPGGILQNYHKFKFKIIGGYINENNNNS